MGIHDNRLIRLDFGEPSFPPPPESRSEAIKYITSTSCHYSPIRGESNLLKKIKQYLQEQYSVAVEEANLSITSGGLMGLNTIIKCLKEEGVLKIYYPDPGFPPYQFMEKYIGIEMEAYPMNEEEEVVHYLKSIAERNDPETIALLITSPNNPNGLTLSSKKLDDLSKCLSEQYIIFDDSFESYIFNESKGRNLILGDKIFRTFSFSKSFSLADYRIGFVISPNKNWSNKISRNHWFSQLSTSVIAQKAALGALNCKKEYLLANKRLVENNIKKAIKTLLSHGINVEHPDGGFFLWVNIEETTLSSDEFVQYSLEHYRLSIISGQTFGRYGEGFIRINCATDKFTLDEGLGRFINCYMERISNLEYSL